jgi:D-tyrosyl-tRNA(Tyr) deacylase
MRFVVQRAKDASVEIDGKINGAIDKGFVVFIGIGENDDKVICDKLIKKMVGLRIFSDSEDKINLSLDQVDGGLLLISQFTLYANCKKGYRPSFTEAAKPDKAEKLYNYIVEKCRESVPKVETGEFGADMKVKFTNDGPFTIILDSDNL